MNKTYLVRVSIDFHFSKKIVKYKVENKDL